MLTGFLYVGIAGLAVAMGTVIWLQITTSILELRERRRVLRLQRVRVLPGMRIDFADGWWVRVVSVQTDGRVRVQVNSPKECWEFGHCSFVALAGAIEAQDKNLKEGTPLARLRL